MQIPNLISRGVLRATLSTLCFALQMIYIFLLDTVL